MSIQQGYPIVIDDYKFTIMSKTEPDFKEYIDEGILNKIAQIEQMEQSIDPEKIAQIKKKHIFIEDRFKIYFTSEDKSGIIEHLFAYTSISQMLCWRIYFLACKNSLELEKFNIYKQDTILDLRLQKHIWEIFDELPYTTKPHTGYKRVTNTSTNISMNTSMDTSITNTVDTNTNPHGTIKCPVFNVDNRVNIDYINSDINLGPRAKMLDMNLYDFKRIYPQFTQITNLSDLQFDLAICKDYGKYRIKNIIFSVRLDNKEEIKSSSIKTSMFMLEDTKKYLTNLEVQIGVCELELKSGSKIYSGMYILNLIPIGVKINRYGLYNEYYYDYQSNEFSDDNTQSIGAILKYHIVSKPIEYKNQLSYKRSDYKITDDDFGDENYNFLAHRNWEKFTNNISEEEKNRIEEFQRILLDSIVCTNTKRKLGETDIETNIKTNQSDINSQRKIVKASKKYKTNPANSFLKKYLKYKNKYIELKNKINPDIL
jgi:hypothetical protein